MTIDGSSDRRARRSRTRLVMPVGRGFDRVGLARLAHDPNNHDPNPSSEAPAHLIETRPVPKLSGDWVLDDEGRG